MNHDYRKRLYTSYVSLNKGLEDAPRGGHARQKKKSEANLRRVLSPWLQDIPRNEPVLDVGCGPGGFMEFLQSEGFCDISGIELSHEQAALARRSFPNVKEASAFDELPRYKDHFSLIAVFDVLEHFDRDEALAFLDMVYAALKPGGLLLLQLPNGDSPLGGGIIWGDATHEYMYTTRSLGHMLRASGFADLKFQEHGPQPVSLTSTIRWLLWKGIRIALRAIHYVETGGPSTNIYTRVFRCCAKKTSDQNFIPPTL